MRLCWSKLNSRRVRQIVYTLDTYGPATVIKYHLESGLRHERLFLCQLRPAVSVASTVVPTATKEAIKNHTK